VAFVITANIVESAVAIKSVADVAADYIILEMSILNKYQLYLISLNQRIPV